MSQATHCANVLDKVNQRLPGLRLGERVYLASFDAVRDHLAEHPEDEDLLASGQVALAALTALATVRAATAGFS